MNMPAALLKSTRFIKGKLRIIRWVIIFVLLVLALLGFLAYLKKNAIWPSGWNSGAFVSLCLSAAILVYFKIPEDMKKRMDKIDSLRKVVVLILAIAGSFGVWLSVRALGLYFNRYLLETSPPYNYLTSNIFTFISFALSANLCFSLTRTLSEVEQSEVKHLIDNLIQAVVIAIFVLAPTYSQSETLVSLGGLYNFIALFLSFVSTLVALVFVRSHYLQEK